MNKGNDNLLQDAFSLIKKWATMFFGILFFGSAVLLWSGLINNLQIVVGLGSATLVGLVWLAHEQMEQLRGLDASLESALASFSGELMTLDECQEDLHRRLTGVSASQRITLQHLGIDMADAWPGVRELLDGLEGSKRKLSLKILMIDPGAKHPTWTDNVTFQGWVTTATVSLQQIRAEFPKWEDRYDELTVEVRAYDGFPFVHGFSVEGDLHVRYFSFCRWDNSQGHTRIDWGKHRYRMVEGQPGVPSLLDLAEIYESAFERLWNEGENRVLLALPEEGAA